MPSPGPPRRRPLPLALLAAAALVATVSLAARDEPRIVYDSEFRGYVPVVAGVERPDLVTSQRNGRAPDSIRDALRLARRGLRAERKAERRAARRGADRASARDERSGRVSRRWLRRQAVVTELQVIGSFDRPVENARVYRYLDPSFYPVNEDETGARLFGAYRYLPFPFPAFDALRAVRLHEEYWFDERMFPVLATHPDMDETNNPWLREYRPSPSSPVEFVGRTDAAGRLLAVSGVFNLRDEDRFPRAIVPDVVRIGYVIVADGYQPAFTEKAFEHGGIEESRQLRLLEAPDAELYGSLLYRAALRRVDAIDASADRSFAEVNLELRRIAEGLDGAVARAPERDRARLIREAGARLAGRLYRRADPVHRAPLARLAATLTPGHAARAFRHAREQHAHAAARAAAAEGASNGDAAGELPAATGGVEALLRETLARDPAFLPAYALLDETLVERGAPEAERRDSIRQLLRLSPFDRWARARLAVSLLKAGKTVEAFDHLRYTWMMTPRLAGDDELGRALADHYWRLGLTEKAGIFTRLLTGEDPEDPRVRVRGGGR